MELNKNKIVLITAIVLVAVLIGFTLRAWYQFLAPQLSGEVGGSESVQQAPEVSEELQKRPEFKRETFAEEQAYLRHLVESESADGQATAVDTEGEDTLQAEASGARTTSPTQQPPQPTPAQSAEQKKLESLRAQQTSSSQDFESQQNHLEDLRNSQ